MGKVVTRSQKLETKVCIHIHTHTPPGVLLSMWPSKHVSRSVCDPVSRSVCDPPNMFLAQYVTLQTCFSLSMWPSTHVSRSVCDPPNIFLAQYLTLQTCFSLSMWPSTHVSRSVCHPPNMFLTSKFRIISFFFPNPTHETKTGTANLGRKLLLLLTLP
jgi:hypothetical protein